VARPVAGTRPQGEEPFSAIALWRVLQIRWRTIAWIAATIVALALAISLWMTTRYEATAQIEFNSENPAALDVQNAPSSAEELDYAVTLSTQANVLQSDTLALQVIRQLDLEKAEKSNSPISAMLSIFESRESDSLPLEQAPKRRVRILEKFHQNLTVRVVGGTRIVEVRYLDRDPARAAAVVNALVNDYLEQYFQTRYTSTRQASDWLSKQLSDLKNDVETSQQRLVDYQKRTGILGESETNNVVMAKLEELNKQLSAAEANRIVKEAVWELAKTGDPELISSMAGSSFIEGVSSGANPTQFGLLPTLRAQEAQLKADIAQTSARLGPQFPKSLQMKSQLADLDESIALEVKKIAARAQNDYIAARNAEGMERALFDKQKQEANELNDSAIQYGILKREVDANRDLYEGLLGKLKQAGVLAGLRSTNIVIVDPGRPAYKPARPNYWLNLALGLVAGIVLGVSAALIKDSLDQAIHTPQDIQRTCGLRLLGVIPLDPAPKSDGIIPQTEWKASQEFKESLRALRTSLLLPDLDCPPQVMLVSSALAGEGKTTVSVNLARALADQGKRVLLVDADLRRPSVHTELDLPNKAPGLNSLLGKSSRAKSSPIKDLGDGLHVVTAGTHSDLPTELLGSRKMEELIERWRQKFDHIVFDTPPVLSVTDAVVLSRVADGVVLVVRADTTNGDALLRTHEILKQSGATVFGVALNAMDYRSPRYAHYFGYSYTAQPQPETQES
jgi:capsular exopolysaccharide synthesis family protein